jgi:hypothetical protein
MTPGQEIATAVLVVILSVVGVSVWRYFRRSP